MEVSFKVSRDNNQGKAITEAPDEYPCLSIFLPILENEYREEKARTDRIDNKAITLLTIIIALITVYVPIFPFKDFAGVYSQSNKCCVIFCAFSLFLLLGIIAIILAIYSAKKVTDIFKPTEYPAVNFEYFGTAEKLSSNPAHSFQISLIDHYQSIILSSSKINTQKAEVLKKQFINVIVIFLLLSISAIGTLICAGICV